VPAVYHSQMPPEEGQAYQPEGHGAPGCTRQPECLREEGQAYQPEGHGGAPGCTTARCPQGQIQEPAAVACQAEAGGAREVYLGQIPARRGNDCPAQQGEGTAQEQAPPGVLLF